MERLVLFLCGFWFWLTRKQRANRYSKIAETLQSAQVYLVSDFASRASTRDRGFMLPNQLEALTILERQRAEAAQTSRRFESLSGCCRLVAEELTESAKAA